ncbi:MAG: carboxypeptidase-like regulatory domain-containing protein [Dehalococcoidia bacterium]
MDVLASLLLVLLGPSNGGPATPVAVATHGRVLDPSGRAIVGATVTLQGDDSGQTRVVVTDAAGRFTVSEFRPGVFAIRLDHPAHRTVHVRPTALPGASESAFTMTPR